MEIINRKTIWKVRGHLVIVMHEDYFMFTAASVAEFGLVKGKFIQFINDGRNWSFYQSDDKDGFPLNRGGGKSKGLRITCSPLVKLFMKTTGYKEHPHSFFLSATGQKQSGSNVIEISTAKPMDSLGK